MTNSFALQRKLIILAIVLPLAAITGYLLASPTEFDSLIFVGTLVMVLAIPVMLKWHHAALVFTWNAGIIIFFLPGSPYVWMIAAAASISVSLLNRILDKEQVLLNVSSITWTLLIVAFVVLVTAKLTGGMGLRSLGSGVYGGKKYFFILLAIIAYFALSCRRIPPASATFYTGAFLLSGLTAVLSNLIYFAGSGAWFLYAFFPADSALSQAYEDFVVNPAGTRFSRLGGLAIAGQAAYLYLVMRYGIRGLLDLSKPWRLLILLGIASLSLLGGFRSAPVFYVIVFAVQFCAEGLLRSRIFPMLLVSGLVAFVALIPLAQRLPLSIQRGLSILPLPVSSAVRIDTESSTEWRLQMWSVLAPEIPKYLWLGKGFAASATDYYLANESVKRNFSRDYELMILSGDYHSGPLSILIPFGIWGVLAFLAFVVAALRLLYNNYQHGDPALRRINTFLFCSFIAKLIFFLFIFGAIHLDILSFVGLVGLSVSINGGMARKQPGADQPVPKPANSKARS